jgi:hypothetical protein
VLCRVRGTTAFGAKVTAVEEDQQTDVWSSFVSAGSYTVVRLDLPASATGVEARIVGYAAGVDGVVIRAEASRVGGEDRATLALSSSDRAQPQVARPTCFRCSFID